jgi:carbon-monoxide dehydrogenase large subunit
MKLARRPILTADIVRHVGDTVALVVAESAEDAAAGADLVAVDYEPLPHVVEPRRALDAEAPVLHAAFGSNRSFDFSLGDARAVEAAFARAAHVSALAFAINRLAPSPIEPRAVIGDYDAWAGRYALYSTTQNPHLIRQWLARETLKAPEQMIRVVSPDVGGGFGQKTYHYPEEPTVLWAARLLGRPVRWTATRAENLMVDTHAREHWTRCRMAFDGEARVLALEVDSIGNLGAYQSPWGALTASALFTTMLSGLYAIPAIHARVQGVYTNTTPLDAYRGAGNPEGTYVVERLIENGAREMGLDPLVVRERNLVPAGRMPYRSATGAGYESGDFPALVPLLKAAADYEGLRAAQRAARNAGRLLGIGLAGFIRASGVGPSRPSAKLGALIGGYDVATLRVHPSGKVTVLAGSHSHGQSHATTYAQIVAARLGLGIEDIDVVEGDTDRIPFGLGTWASRSITVVGGALVAASDRVIEKGRRLAAHLLECAPADLEFAEAAYRVKGTDRRIGFVTIADAAYSGADYPEGFELGLEETAYFDPADMNYPYGLHLAVVTVDAETGQVTLERYVAVDDVGIAINPMVVDGQRHGGIAQGIGQALLEAVRYDRDSGQLLTGSYMDYALPRADDVPAFALATQMLPTATNPLGVKGVGELGASGPPAAIGNAVVDALWHLGVRQVDLPATPERVWRAIRAARQPGRP